MRSTEPPSCAGDARGPRDPALVRAAAAGSSPYATGGGGITFERKVAVRYLACLLTGDAAAEVGDGRSVVSVGFQQAPGWAVDDLVIHAARADESEPSMSLMLAVRRTPNLVVSDVRSRALVRQFVMAAADDTDGEGERRWGLVVAGSPTHAMELKELATHAKTQMDASGFFELIETPRKFSQGVRRRLDHMRRLVQLALEDLNDDDFSDQQVRQRTWEILAGLEVLTLHLEPSDEADWVAVIDDLKGVATGLDLEGGARLRDRLFALASDYAPQAARINRTLLRRASHTLLDSASRSYPAAWRQVDDLDHRARSSVRDRIESGDRVVRLDRSAAVGDLNSALARSRAVVVSGVSGTGKSALALLSFGSEADPETTQVLCISLRQVPALMIELEGVLGCPVSTLLSEISAPQRVLVIDGAEVAVEGSQDTLCGLVDAALANDMKLVLVVANEARQAVHDLLKTRVGDDVAAYTVAPLSDAELDQVVEVFPELERLWEEARSRELLRRPVVVDLLVRSGVQGTPLTEADAMGEVWSGLVLRSDTPDRGIPDTREHALLRLADRDLRSSNPLEALGQINPEALAGLRRDGILASSEDNQFAIGPGFAHDELRRYAIARLLLGSGDIVATIHQAGAPRWALSAARLACQAALAAADMPANRVSGRFARLQASFDSLVKAGHSRRWGDVPGEALLTLADPSEVLTDAWTELRSADGAGLRRLARLADQRLRAANGLVSTPSIEPVVALLLEEAAPWTLGDYAADLVREWLHGLITAAAPAGHPLRTRLRQLLVEECATADRLLVERQQARAEERACRTPEGAERDRLLQEQNRHLATEIGWGGPERRQRPQVPGEIKDEVVVEFLALTGPDLDDEGAAILRRIARDAPASLAPALEQLLTGQALSTAERGLLAELTEAYYLDDDYGDLVPSQPMWDGIRGHHAVAYDRFGFCAWYRGPFMALFQTDFRSGVAVLNRLLNHAARIRAQVLARLGQDPFGLSDHDAHEAHSVELDLVGEPRQYIGDAHVWRWRSGHMAAVGPYPCMSALQALELVCDQLIASDVRIDQLVSVLLSECENLAMVGLVFGVLVRHLESSGHLLDPYLAQPAVWRNEFSRIASDSRQSSDEPNDLVAAERRGWTPREVVMMLVLRAERLRLAELRAVGNRLLDNALREIQAARSEADGANGPEADRLVEEQLATVRAWASFFDRDTYHADAQPDGLRIRAEPPADVTDALQDTVVERERMEQESRLLLRYDERFGEDPISSITAEDLNSDLAAAKKLIEQPSSFGGGSPWDAPALVAAAVLEAHLIRDADFTSDDLSFAADIVLTVIGDADSLRHFEIEESFFEQGADRSAARALPLLLLPAAAPILAHLHGQFETATRVRVMRGGLSLARATPGEVRMQLARGLDHCWATPCARQGRCHHEDGWQLATETMRDCVLGGWIPGTGIRQTEFLNEPLGESLAGTDGGSLQFMRLDPAIRALAPATAAAVCVSDRARELLRALLDAQRRALLSYGRGDSSEGTVVIISGDVDQRSTHTLVAARALLMLNPSDRDAMLDDFMDEYALAPKLLTKLITALSAAGEESPRRAAAARQVWPNILRRVLRLRDEGHDFSCDWQYGDSVLDALVPEPASTVHFLYREVQDEPARWWEPLSLQAEIGDLLATGETSPWCPGRIVQFLQAVDAEDQARLGLPWIQPLVRADPNNVRAHSPILQRWLPEIQPAAIAFGLHGTWQAIVDDLVVAGDLQLAPYSE